MTADAAVAGSVVVHRISVYPRDAGDQHQAREQRANVFQARAVHPAPLDLSGDHSGLFSARVARSWSTLSRNLPIRQQMGQGERATKTRGVAAEYRADVPLSRLVGATCH